MLTKYRKVILFNKNLLISGIVSFLAGSLVTQSYALFDRNNMSNAIITLTIGYCVYIPVFAFLFYRDNKSRYIDPLTGKKNSKNIIEDIMKLFGTFTISEVIYSKVVHSLFLTAITCPAISGSYNSRIDSLGSISYIN